MSYQDDYYDPEASGYGDFEPHHVFKSELQVRNPGTGKDDVTYLYVAPAFSNVTDPNSWSHYRYPAGTVINGHDVGEKFTKWIRGYRVHEWVGGNKGRHIIDPLSIDPESKAANPVSFVIEAAKKNPKWFPLIGWGPDGKKPKDEKLREEIFKQTVVKPSIWKFVLNAINPARVEDGENERCCLYTLPSMAVQGSWKKETGKEKAVWGLFAYLNILSRGVDPAAIAADFTRKWHWGDITRADHMICCKVFKGQSPIGGAVNPYNMHPVDQPYGAQSVGQHMHDGRFTWLDTRVPLIPECLFVEYNPVEIVDILTGLLGEHNDLLIAAFEGRYPGYKDNLLKTLGIVGAVQGASVPAAAAPAAAAPAAVTPPTSSYAPPATTVPPVAPVAPAPEATVPTPTVPTPTVPTPTVPTPTAPAPTTAPASAPAPAPAPTPAPAPAPAPTQPAPQSPAPAAPQTGGNAAIAENAAQLAERLKAAMPGQQTPPPAPASPGILPPPPGAAS